MKKKPSGFVAKCQCGRITGAIGISRTAADDAGKILGKWLMDGCIVEPKFDGSWCVLVEPCLCNLDD